MEIPITPQVQAGPRPPRAVAIAVSAGVVLFAASLAAVVGAHPTGPRSVTYTGRSMGTYTRIVLVTADSAGMAVHAGRAQAAFHRTDSLMSNWTQTSEVARLNRESHAAATQVHPEVAAVIAHALAVGKASAGAFDITVEPLVRVWGFLGGKPREPDSSAAAEAFRHVGPRQIEFDAKAGTLRLADPAARIDLGGIAKGYAVDEAVEALSAQGVTDGLVDISGNMRALGAPFGADHWSIGIRDPRDRMGYFARVRLNEGGLSTSGKYEQFVSAAGRTYGHIMDPRTGRPAEGLISVTVFAPTAMDADAWSTALFVLGLEEAMRTARDREDLMAILVAPGADGTDVVWVERALRHRFVLEPGASRHFELRHY